MTEPALTPQQAKLTQQSPLRTYKEVAVGAEVSIFYWLYFEIVVTLFSNMSGIIGLVFRFLFYPKLFSRCGKKTAFGKSLILRNPAKISLGKKCLIDDAAILDARGSEASIALGDYVSLGRGSALVAKNAHITLGQGVNIGSNCRIATQSKISIGESSLIAAYCYIGAGNHRRSDSEKPLISQAMEIKGGVTIGKNVWLGTRVTILDGVTIGDGAIIGAHALVREDVPAGKVAVGIPARVL